MLHEKNKTQDGIYNEDIKLFEELRKVRLDLAREEKIPPYIIFSDIVLKDIAKYRPQNRENMLKIKGIRQRKFEKYGQIFIDKIIELGYKHKKHEEINISKNIEREEINYIQNQKILHENAYKKRENEEDKNLQKLFKNGVSLRDLSSIFKRNTGGIRSRLKKLGLIE